MNDLPRTVADSPRLPWIEPIVEELSVSETEVRPGRANDGGTFDCSLT